MPLNYERSQFDRLLAAPAPEGRYLIKVATATTNTSTKWLSATRDQVERIADILSEDGE